MWGRPLWGGPTTRFTGPRWVSLASGGPAIRGLTGAASLGLPGLMSNPGPSLFTSGSAACLYGSILAVHVVGEWLEGSGF